MLEMYPEIGSWLALLCNYPIILVVEIVPERCREQALGPKFLICKEIARQSKEPAEKTLLWCGHHM